MTFCFSFYDQLDCDSFTTALQAALKRQQQQQLQWQVQQQQQAQHVADLANSDQQQQQAEADPVAEPQAAGGPAGKQQAVGATSHLALQADARAAVKVCLWVPTFNSGTPTETVICISYARCKLPEISRSDPSQESCKLTATPLQQQQQIGSMR